jgi:hypothetical protein
LTGDFSMAISAEGHYRNLIGDKVKQARKKAKPNVTQLDLIARLETKGIHLEATAVSKIEAKTRPVTDIELVAISEALGVSLMWLLGKE